MRGVNIGRNVVILDDPVKREGVITVCEKPVYYTGVIDLALTVRVDVSSVEVCHVKLAWRVVVELKKKKS